MEPRSLLYLAFIALIVRDSNAANGEWSTISCDFLSFALCQWENELVKNDVTLLWSRTDFTSTILPSLLDPLSTTFGYGPMNDHSGDTFYAIAYGKEGDLARFYTPLVQGSFEDHTTVLSFWYHVGSVEANLTVYVVHEDRTKPWVPLWTIPQEGLAMGSRDPWQEGLMTVNYPAKFQVAFEAVLNTDNETKTYVAVDDVTLHTGELVQTCDFEGSIFGDLCNFMQQSAGPTHHFDWTRNTGETPSLDTGPLFDHTLGEGQKGYYVFMEATRPEDEVFTSLTSVEYFKKKGGSCQLAFYYHAFGSQIGGLSVQIGDEVYGVLIADNTLDEWLRHEIDITEVSGKFTITFIGQRGGGNLGDIAIDDISLVGGEGCNGVDVCASFPCYNGGTCLDWNDGTFSCTCPRSYPLPFCETVPTKQPLESQEVIAIAAGAAGAAIIILAIVCACCHNRKRNGTKTEIAVPDNQQLHEVRKSSQDSSDSSGSDSTNGV